MKGDGWYSFPPPKPGDEAARAVHFLSVLYISGIRVQVVGVGNGLPHVIPQIAVHAPGPGPPQVVRVDSGKGQDRTPMGKAPVGRAIDGPLADAAALLRHYSLSDDGIEQIRAWGIAGWLSRSNFAPFDSFLGWAHILLTDECEYRWPKASLAYDSALYRSRPVSGVPCHSRGRRA